MCGIFGVITGEKNNIDGKEFTRLLKELFVLSETRGKEAAGICAVSDHEVAIYKDCVRAKKLLVTEDYKKMMFEVGKYKKKMCMGHARMVTNGSGEQAYNNQPVIRGELACIHNGIIVNDHEIWEDNKDMHRTAEVDTEVLLALLEKNNYKNNFLKAFGRTLAEIRGSLNIALVDRTSDNIFLYTNLGSLYYWRSLKDELIVFASERFILEAAVHKSSMHKYFLESGIIKVEPGKGIFINLTNCNIQNMVHCPELSTFSDISHQRRLIYDTHHTNMTSRVPMISKTRVKEIENLLKVDEEKIDLLKRCTKCLLPETFPGIHFDDDGVCSICHEYQHIKYAGSDQLIEELNKTRDVNSYYDCIVPLSGGRDSCYMLHYLVKELHINPVAYTYDWGMVTDLARRNIQRMCSALGVEHILISADIKKKRHNIHLNVDAWLHRPELATVPLFMAGDKQFFYYAQLLKRQMKVDSILFGMNRLEETKFKVRFAKIGNTGKNDIHYDLSTYNKISMLTTYGKEFIKNPRYLNTSLLDTFSGYVSYYMLPKDYKQFFDYISWNQNEVENTILREYDWETDPHNEETWRIGDGTAPFYNQIYYKMAGFTEFDTFKSNQIREGMISRAEALQTLKASNRVSPEGFMWYCDAIQIDPVEALRIINKQKSLIDRFL